MKKLNLKNVEPRVLKGNIDGRDWYSQKGQDSIIDHIMSSIGTTNKVCVEFGGGDGYNGSNTLYLSLNGWQRILFDRNHDDPRIPIHRVFLTAENICDVFDNAGAPRNFDFLSVDVDGNDYWFLDSLLKKFSPRLIMSEINARFSSVDKRVMKYSSNYSWDGHSWYGAGIYAYNQLASRYGYTVVWSFKDEVFLVKTECLHEDDRKTKIDDFYVPNWEIYAGTDTTTDDFRWITLA
jgi:hypothetical protein